MRPPPVARDLLAIMHFKFTPDLRRKIDYALKTGGYFEGSKEYRLMHLLLKRMEARSRGFLSSRSMRMERPADLYAGAVGTLA
jgi:hypothetical protein